MKSVVATICLLATVLATGAAAQPLVDPMRPPALGGEASAAPSGPTVHMIVIAPERRYAVIDGQTVTQGSRFGNSRVVRIAESEVTLLDAAGESRVLKLLPQAEKRIVAPRKSEPRTAPGERGKK